MAEKKVLHLRFGIISLMVLLVAFSRLLPYLPNFAPIWAMVSFAVVYFSFIIPIIRLWLGDLTLTNGSWDGWCFAYAPLWTAKPPRTPFTAATACGGQKLASTFSVLKETFNVQNPSVNVSKPEKGIYTLKIATGVNAVYKRIFKR